MAAAARLFEERGYGATTMEMIASLAGVGVATLYNRFRSKAGLVRRVYDAQDRLAPDPRHGDQDRPVDVLIREKLVELSARLARERTVSGSSTPVLGERAVQDIASALSGSLVELLEKGQERGEIRPELDPGDVATLATSLLVAHLQSGDEPYEQAATRVVELLFWGVGSRH